MKLIATSEDKTMMKVELDGSELTIGESMIVDREKLRDLLTVMQSDTVTLSRYLLMPEAGRAGLKPMETLLIEGDDHKAFILAPIERS